MKKFLLSFALLLSLGITVWAQAPKKFNYQGIARNTAGTPMASTPIGLRFTIHEGSASGSVDYQETQIATTNTFGLYNVFIGVGAVITGGGGAANLGAVNWASGDKYLQVEIDPLGADNYSNAGTAQLLSVPFALYAGAAPANGVTSVTAGSGLNGGTITTTGTVSMPNVGTASTYGSATSVPVITTDAQGRVTNVVNTPITSGAGTITSINSGTGLTGGPITSTGTLSLATAGTPGTYGSGTTVPVFTTDAYGRVISVASTPITAAGSGTVTSVTAGSGLSGGTITTTGTVSMPPVGIAGSYGSATGIPAFTTDAYGRVTAVTVNPVSSISSTGTTNYIAKFTSPTAISNSGMYNTTGGQVGLGTIAPIATFHAESATDTMAGNFVISSATPPGTGILCATYTGTGLGSPSVAMNGQALPDLFTSVGVGVIGVGGSLGVSAVAESEDFAGAPTAVQGQSFSDGNYGVAIGGFANAAAFGADKNYGIYGTTDGSGLTDDYAGEFVGDVNITGALTALTKAFKMDHPLDPANKYLYHSCVESSDMMNIYTGNITTDASGTAVVSFPDYMEALNTDFRYQLTVIGTFAQAIVSKEMSGNKFEIKTSIPNTKVSWQITGVRHDPYAIAHPIVVEVEKKGSNKGKYIAPEVYGKSKDLQEGRMDPKQLNCVKTPSQIAAQGTNTAKTK